jgi:hypothetical protein
LCQLLLARSLIQRTSFIDSNLLPIERRVTMLVAHSQNRLVAYAAGLVLLFALSSAQADPSARVARLGYTEGQVSFSPAGDAAWVQAALNRPLTTGDHLWTDVSSRAELQIGGAAIRMGASTDVMLTNLDDSIAQLQLSQGSLRVRVRQMARNQSFEIDTPNLAFSLSQAGDYRIDVDPSGDSTQVTVQVGQAQVDGGDASYVVKAGQGYRFYSTNLSDYETVRAQPEDELDRWSHDRDRRVATSNSARYVSYDVVGYEDLDANGSWRSDPSFGNVWRPNRVPSGWTPYRDGHWTWIDPWGWSWVDDAPWGYAVSHYGRWAHVSGSWGWIPGPRREQAVYAPALVVFLGGKNFQGAVPVGDSSGAVGWFPLAPREVYQPAYQVSRGYFDRVNRSNAVVSQTNVTNIYNTNVTKTTNTTNNQTTVVYVNQRIPGAVVAVPKAEFTQSHPVAKHTLAVAADAANRADATPVAAVAPTPQSLHGGAPEARVKPPTHERRFIARTAAPAPALAFAAQQAQLAEKPGTPIDEQQRKQLRSKAPAAPIHSVTVVTVAKAATPTTAPPAVAPKGRPPTERKADEAKATPVLGDASKADPAKLKPSAADRAKTPAPQIPDTKAEAEKTNQAKADAAKSEALKAENSRAAAAKAEVEKGNAAKAESVKTAAAKSEADKASHAKTDAAKADAVKAESARAAATKAEAANAESAKAAVAKAEAEKANRAKADAAKSEALKADQSRAAATKAEDANAESAKAAVAKAEAEKANRAKALADKADASKAESSRAAAVKADGEKANTAKADRAKEDAKKADSVRAASAKAEADKANRAKALADKADASKAESARASTAKANREKVNAAKSEVSKKASDPDAPRVRASEPK